MSKIVAAALAGALVLAGAGYAEAKKSNTGRNIAIGVGAAVATGIILNEAAKAERRSAPARVYESDYEHEKRCNRWYRLCDEGERWACRKADNNC